MKDFSIEPEESKTFLEKMGTSGLTQKQKAAQVLLRPSLSLPAMIEGMPRFANALDGFTTDMLEQAEIQAKYEVYIEKEKNSYKKWGNSKNSQYLIILTTIVFHHCQQKHCKNLKR